MSSLIFAATSDLSGKVRGKAFPASDLPKRLMRGMGWTPTNVQINCFDGIAESPFGALDDLLLIPDENASVHMDLAGMEERFMFGDIVDVKGQPWALCLRSMLRKALDRLKTVADVQLLAAFEHEFQLKSGIQFVGDGYGRAGFEAQRAFCETLINQIEKAGFKPDSIMKEFGPNQYEIVIGPEVGVRAADAAAITRELTRSCARFHGEEATYTPIMDPSSVGNGVHIHFSFLDSSGKPVTYDPKGVCGMAWVTGAFAAGVLKYMDSILALTAPSVISYHRLVPHRWSAAYNNLGLQDREASLRICPITTKDPASVPEQYNLEYRAADGAASPYLALAALVHAGAQGIEEGLTAPSPTQEDLSELSSEELAKRGIHRLPTDIQSALEKFQSNKVVTDWFPEVFAPVYIAHKQSEIKHLSGLDVAAQCKAYASTY